MGKGRHHIFKGFDSFKILIPCGQNAFQKGAVCHQQDKSVFLPLFLSPGGPWSRGVARHAATSGRLAGWKVEEAPLRQPGSLSPKRRHRRGPLAASQGSGYLPGTARTWSSNPLILFIKLGSPPSPGKLTNTSPSQVHPGTAARRPSSPQTRL